MKLPERPDPQQWYAQNSIAVGFTTKQMDQYGRACAEAMREACFDICLDKHGAWNEGSESSSGPKDCGVAIQGLDIKI